MQAEDPPSIKLCDFGISRQHSFASTFTNTESKTTSYAAPEVFGFDTSKQGNRVDARVDIWALGCVTAELVTGCKFFEGASCIELFSRSASNRQTMLGILDGKISTDGADFVSQLLQPDPRNRPDARTALEMPWIRGNNATSTGNTAAAPRTVQAGGGLKNGTTLMHNAASHGDIETMDWLRGLGQEIGVKDDFGATPMHYAALQGQVAMIDHLRGIGQDIGAKDIYGRTPMHYATLKGQLAMVDHLRGLGQDVSTSDIDGKTPIHEAIEIGQIARVDHLRRLDQDISVKDSYGRTLMHYAAKTGQIAVVDRLRGLGQDVSVSDINGKTPMHLAAEMGQIAMVDHLYRLGQDVRVKDCDGCTPLYYADRCGQSTMANHLISLASDAAASSERPTFFSKLFRRDTKT